MKGGCSSGGGSGHSGGHRTLRRQAPRHAPGIENIQLSAGFIRSRPSRSRTRLFSGEKHGAGTVPLLQVAQNHEPVIFDQRDQIRRDAQAQPDQVAQFAAEGLCLLRAVPIADDGCRATVPGDGSWSASVRT